MSKTVSEVLKHYNELRDVEPDSELFHIKADIERAIEMAPLTQEELNIITALYLTDHEAPVRQDSSGRPNHPWAATLIGLDEDKSENAKAIYVSRRLKSAVDKLAEFLGDGYDDQETTTS
jgi:hypothetical protein